MSGSESEHFAADQDALDRFVLGRMGNAERAHAQMHLNACAACRRAVEAEQLLVSAVRAHARAQLKERLGRNIGTQRQGLPWPHIIAAAAIIFIITGIGLIAGWLELFVQHPALVHSDSVATAMLQQEASSPTPVEQETRKAVTSKEENAKRQPPASTATSPTAGSATPRVAPPQTAQEPGQPAMAAPAQQKKDMEQAAPAETPSYGLSQNEDLVFGQVTRLAGYQASKEKIGTLQRSFKRRAAAEPLGAQRQSPVNAGFTREVRVLLRPRASLARTNPEAFSDSTQVPALIDQRGDTIVLTPFVSDIRDSSNLSVEQPTNDSIVVKLPGRMIGYRIPVQYQQRNLRIRELKR